MEPLVKGHKIAQRYALLSSIHKSKLSQIWLAHDDTLKSRVVIKIADAFNPLSVNLLQNEYNMCAQCVHAGTVRAFEFHTEGNLVFVTLEHLGGGDFQSLMCRPQAQFLPGMIQIAEALQYVHQQGVVHRDVKLSNFVFDRRGHARLIDFGVASVSGQQGLRSGGSPRSMSPQQRAGEPPQYADDLYGFGVALYRLLTGQWPDDDLTVAPAGGVLGELVTRLLHPDPHQRPGDMGQVIEHLRFALAEQGNVTLPPDEFEFQDDDEQRIEVINPDIGVASASTPNDVPKVQKKSYRFVPLLVLYGVIAAVALFYFLPKFAANKQSGSSIVMTTTDAGKPARAGATAAPRQDVEPWQLAQEARLRKEAETTLEQLLDKQFYLEDQQVVLWAQSEFDALKEQAIAGDKLFRQKKYTEALALYQQGLEVGDTLAQRADTILPDTIKSANDALASGDAESARSAFALALQIEPTSSEAAAGAKRAENLDAVVALVAEAETLEQSGQTSAALSTYKQAQALDPQWSAAGAGVKRIQARLASRAYSKHMSDGFQALEQGDFADAHSAFERAQRISPNSREVKDAFAQLETAIRLQDRSSVQNRAQSLEQQGDWRGAAREYQAILDIDGSVQSARDALRRVTARAETEEELSQLLANPIRLSSDSVYRQAEVLLARLEPYLGDAGIATQAASLRQLMAASRVPVVVKIRSDGKTNVLVYQVGRLGTFTSETLEIRPGEYTAVGTRSGFRDVRVNFTISPGQRNADIEVVCQEAI